MPHQYIISVLHKLFKLYFNDGLKDQQGYRKYLTVIETDCVSTKKKCGFYNYTIEQRKIMINHLIKECYFAVCDLSQWKLTQLYFVTNLYLYEFEPNLFFSQIRTDNNWLFNVLKIFLFTTSETVRDYYL